MIFGVGVDTVQVERFTKYQPGDPFIQKYFTSAECTYLGTQGEGFAQSAAGLFAAKEAFVKGLGVGFRELSPKDVGCAHAGVVRYPRPVAAARGELGSRRRESGAHRGSGRKRGRRKNCPRRLLPRRRDGAAGRAAPTGIDRRHPRHVGLPAGG